MIEVSDVTISRLEEVFDIVLSGKFARRPDQAAEWSNAIPRGSG
jgi:hypothetical protein